MVAKEASIKDVVETEPHRLEVPFFQRKYVWQEENWEEMLQAVERFDEERPFWGSIIIKRAGKDRKRNFGKAYIIDGQQRLTTIAILTKAIYDSANKQDRERRFRSLVDCDLLFKPYASATPDEYEIIIEHSRADRQDFEYIIKTGIYNDEEVQVNTNQVDLEKRTGSAVLRCYLYYREIMKKKTQQELELLMNNLYNDEKVFVLITLDDDDINEQIIFDSINRAGQKLTTSDIIKNNIFKKMMTQTENSQLVEKNCDIYWDNIFWEDEFWYNSRQFGNTKRSHIDFLLYCVACNLWSYDVLLEKGVNCSLEKVYEENTNQYGYDEMFNVVKEIAKFAVIYKKYIYDFSQNLDNETFCKNDNLKRLLLVTDKFNIQMFYPAVLKLLSESTTYCDLVKKEIVCNLDDDKCKDGAHNLETYIVRHKIIGSSTSQYTKKCLDVLKNGFSVFYSDGKNSKTQVITDENIKIREELGHPKNDVAKMILFCLELEKWDEKDDINSFSYNFELEHIMPKQWEQYWPLTKGDSSPDERNAAINSIGNMLLLSQGLNKHIKNREFNIKVEGEIKGRKRLEGYRDKTQLKTTKEIIDSYNNGNTEWTEREINKRTQEIYDNVISHWNVT